MISIKALKSSLFNASAFDQNGGASPSIDEPDQQEGKLAQVTLQTGASQVISINRDWYSNTDNLFRKWHDKLFRGCCDGIYLMEKGGKGYVLVVELKSRGDETRGASQIITSMIKVKHMLVAYASFVPQDYTYLGILISQVRGKGDDGGGKKSECSYEGGMDMKAQQCAQNCEAWLRDLVDALCFEGSATADMNGPSWAKIDLTPFLKESFPIYYYQVGKGCTSGSIDISSLLSTKNCRQS